MSAEGGVELGLLALVVVLAIGAGLLLGLALRRRAQRSEAAVAPSAPSPAPIVRRARPTAPPMAAAGGGLAGVAGVAVTTAERVCPSCRTSYQDMLYCQRDARRLVPAEELAAPGRASGLTCPRCSRGFEPGLRRCPHDGAELVPHAMYQAARRRPDPAPTGVLAKVCPVCRRRFDLSSRFCGRDGHELVVIN